MRSDGFGKPVVLLQVDCQICHGLLADFDDCLGIGLAVNRDANNIGPGFVECVDLSHGGIDVSGPHGRHALHGDRVPGTNGDRANADRASWIALDLHGE